MTNLDRVLKTKDITLLTKVHIVKAMVFPVVMYRSDSWTIEKAEFQRTDAVAEAPIFWPPNTKGQLIRKDPDAGKN